MSEQTAVVDIDESAAEQVRYAQDFDAGERHAFADRQAGMRPMSRCDFSTSLLSVAWWDGYTAGSPTWAQQRPSGLPWWVDRRGVPGNRSMRELD